MQSNLDSTHLLETINREYEQSFTAAALCAKEMSEVEDSQLAAKRTIGYNPNSKEILEIFPEYKEIIDELTTFINKLTTNMEGENLALLGYCYLTLGDFPNAFSVFVHLKPLPQSNDPAFDYAMGIVFAHYKYNSYALNCFNRVLSSDSNYLPKEEVKFRISILQRTMGNFDTSIQLLESIQRKPPSNLTIDDIVFQIAYTNQLKGSNQIAGTLYKELFQRYPKNLNVMQQYCLFLFLQNSEGDPLTAKTVISKALSEYPTDPILLIIAARIAMKQNDMATAYLHYTSQFCTTYYTSSPYFWCGLGVLYYKNGQAQDAIVAFQRALFLKNEIPEAWLNIGLIFQQEEKYQNAVKLYTTGLQNCPNCPLFNERINSINGQRTNHRKAGSNATIIEIPDSKFIPAVPEQFANDYIMATPKLPVNCYGKELKLVDQLELLSTYPKSLFL